MRKRILVFALLACVLQISCTRFNPDEITIIDGIKLGTSVNDLFKQYDSLNLPEEDLFSKTNFYDFDELKYNLIKFRLTKMFNFSEYNTQSTNHYGIFSPGVLAGTQNVIGMNVVLVHTDGAFLNTNRELISLTEKYNSLGIDQTISDDLIKKIEGMLTKKYGPPQDVVKWEYTTFSVIEGSKMNTYNSKGIPLGELVKWKTKYLNIELFKGSPCNNKSYNPQMKTYMRCIGNDPKRILNLLYEKPCSSYPYISYELNDEAKKILDLEKVKL